MKLRNEINQDSKEIIIIISKNKLKEMATVVDEPRDYFADLDKKTLRRIFNFMYPNQFARLRGVCKRWNSVFMAEVGFCTELTDKIIRGTTSGKISTEGIDILIVYDLKTPLSKEFFPSCDSVNQLMLDIASEFRLNVKLKSPLGRILATGEILNIDIWHNDKPTISKENIIWLLENCVAATTYFFNTASLSAFNCLDFDKPEQNPFSQARIENMEILAASVTPEDFKPLFHGILSKDLPNLETCIFQFKIPVDKFPPEICLALYKFLDKVMKTLRVLHLRNALSTTSYRMAAPLDTTFTIVPKIRAPVHCTVSEFRLEMKPEIGIDRRLELELLHSFNSLKIISFLGVPVPDIMDAVRKNSKTLKTLDIRDYPGHLGPGEPAEFDCSCLEDCQVLKCFMTGDYRLKNVDCLPKSLYFFSFVCCYSNNDYAPITTESELISIENKFKNDAIIIIHLPGLEEGNIKEIIIKESGRIRIPSNNTMKKNKLRIGMFHPKLRDLIVKQLPPRAYKWMEKEIKSRITCFMNGGTIFIREPMLCKALNAVAKGKPEIAPPVSASKADRILKSKSKPESENEKDKEVLPLITIATNTNIDSSTEMAPPVQPEIKSEIVTSPILESGDNISPKPNLEPLDPKPVKRKSGPADTSNFSIDATKFLMPYLELEDKKNMRLTSKALSKETEKYLVFGYWLTGDSYSWIQKSRVLNLSFVAVSNANETDMSMLDALPFVASTINVLVLECADSTFSKDPRGKRPGRDLSNHFLPGYGPTIQPINIATALACGITTRVIFFNEWSLTNFKNNHEILVEVSKWKFQNLCVLSIIANEEEMDQLHILMKMNFPKFNHLIIKYINVKRTSIMDHYSNVFEFLGRHYNTIKRLELYHPPLPPQCRQSGRLNDPKTISTPPDIDKVQLHDLRICRNANSLRWILGLLVIGYQVQLKKIRMRGVHLETVLEAIRCSSGSIIDVEINAQSEMDNNVKNPSYELNTIYLKACVKLKNLNLHNFTCVTGLAQNIPPSIQTLALSVGCIKKSDLLAIGHNCPNLKAIALQRNEANPSKTFSLYFDLKVRGKNNPKYEKVEKAIAQLNRVKTIRFVFGRMDNLMIHSHHPACGICKGVEKEFSWHKQTEWFDENENGFIPTRGFFCKCSSG